VSDSFDPQKAFDAYYYQLGCGAPYVRNEQWLSFFQGIADRIIADLQPKTVLDAGCAKGFLVEGFRNHGLDAWGVDISEYAIQEVHETIKPFCWVGSISDPFPQKYDLIVTIEVLEHMPAGQGKTAIANLCAHSDCIIFTSTPFDYKETTHYNVQPPEYWSREFARHSFFRDVDFDASFITAWAVLYRKSEKPAHQLAYDYERRFWLLKKENNDLRQLATELRLQIQQLSGRILEIEQAADKTQDDLGRKSGEINSRDKDLIDLLLVQDHKIKQLNAELEQLNLENQDNKSKASVLQQRWEALEATRTWKFLSTFYKFRTSSRK